MPGPEKPRRWPDVDVDVHRKLYALGGSPHVRTGLIRGCCLLVFGGAVLEGLGEIDAWSRRDRRLAVVNPPVKAAGEDVLSLRGEWEYTPHETLRGSYNAYRNESEWTRSGLYRLHVPGCWESQGIGSQEIGRAHV